MTAARPYILCIIAAIALDAGAVIVNQWGAERLSFVIFAIAAILSAIGVLFLLKKGETR